MKTQGPVLLKHVCGLYELVLLNPQLDSVGRLWAMDKPVQPIRQAKHHQLLAYQLPTLMTEVNTASV